MGMDDITQDPGRDGAPFVGGQNPQSQQTASVPNFSGLQDTSAGSGPPGSDGARYYTIQRVNGNGANGKTDTAMGGHRHSLEESDRIKKNTIWRHLLKGEKERKKYSVSGSFA